MNLLMLNMAVDLDAPISGFTTRWIEALAGHMDRIHVITMYVGRVEVPQNVQVYSLGKEKGYSEIRRGLEFYRHILGIVRENHVDACFSHMVPKFTVLAAPLLKVTGVPIVQWYAHPSVTKSLRLAHRFSARQRGVTR